MQLSIEIPDEISRALSARWADVPRHVLETIAIDGYKAGVLTSGEVRVLLGLDRFQVDEILKKAGALFDYPQEEIDREISLLRRLTEQQQASEPAAPA